MHSRGCMNNLELSLRYPSPDRFLVPTTHNVEKNKELLMHFRMLKSVCAKSNDIFAISLFALAAILSPALLHAQSFTASGTDTVTLTGVSTFPTTTVGSTRTTE